MKILLTGFKPFLGQQLNPSELLATDISKKNNSVESIVLPVEFTASFNILKKKLQSDQFDYLIMLGQAAGRNKVSLEKIALNWIQTANQDEAGQAPITGKINESEPLAYMSLFPIDSIYQELKAQFLPIEISFSAGAYVCNDLYFRVCSEFKNLKSVFVHVPLIEEQVLPNQPRPFLKYEEQLKIVSLIVSELEKK